MYFRDFTVLTAWLAGPGYTELGQDIASYKAQLGLDLLLFPGPKVDHGGSAILAEEIAYRGQRFQLTSMVCAELFVQISGIQPGRSVYSEVQQKEQADCLSNDTASAMWSSVCPTCYSVCNFCPH